MIFRASTFHKRKAFLSGQIMLKGMSIPFEINGNITLCILSYRAKDTSIAHIQKNSTFCDERLRC
jgi:hypothetical protein